MVFDIIVYVLVIGLLVGLFLYKKKKNTTLNGYIIKGVIIALFCVVLIKSFAADGFVAVINGGNLYHYDTYVKKTDVLESLCRWGLLVNECLILSLLISDNKNTKWIISMICLPFSILALIYFPFSIRYFINPVTFGLHLVNNIFAGIIMVIEYALVISINFYFHLYEHEKLNEKKQVLKIGLFSLASCIPFLVFASIFGTTGIEIESFNYAHILWIITVPILYIIVVLLFKGEDQVTKNTILAVMVFYLVIHFTGCFKVGYRTNRLPIQLCNIAAFFFVYILLSKNQKFFNFVYIANPLGAIIALFVTDTGNLFNFWMIHYIIEHTYVILIPLLIAKLGYLERPKLKIGFKHFFIFVSIYYVFCIFFNAIHNGLVVPKANSDYINTINAFFMVECPLEDLALYKILCFGKFKLFGQEFYLGYLLFIYVAYSSFSFLFYEIGNLIGLCINKISSLLKKEEVNI